MYNADTHFSKLWAKYLHPSLQGSSEKTRGWGPSPRLDKLPCCQPGMDLGPFPFTPGVTTSNLLAGMMSFHFCTCTMPTHISANFELNIFIHHFRGALRRQGAEAPLLGWTNCLAASQPWTLAPSPFTPGVTTSNLLARMMPFHF